MGPGREAATGEGKPQARLLHSQPAHSLLATTVHTAKCRQWRRLPLAAFRAALQAQRQVA